MIVSPPTGATFTGCNLAYILDLTVPKGYEVAGPGTAMCPRRRDEWMKRHCYPLFERGSECCRDQERSKLKEFKEEKRTPLSRDVFIPIWHRYMISALLACEAG